MKYHIEGETHPVVICELEAVLFFIPFRPLALSLFFPD